MAVLPAVRVSLLAAIVLFSVVVLAVLFNFEALSTTVPPRIAFRVGIASAIATTVLIVATLIVDLVRKGKGVTSMVWFDLVRTFALWALWLATAVSITTVKTIDSCLNAKSNYFTRSKYDASNSDGSMCLLFRISQVSTWIITFLAFTWFVVLLTASNIAVARGYTGVWTSPLRLHPIGLGGPSSSSSSLSPPKQDDFRFGSDATFVPSPYGLLVSSYEQRAAWRDKRINGGHGRAGRPRREGEDVEFASTSTFTVQTVHLDPPPPAVVVATAPTVVDLEAQQPQPRRID